MSKKNHLIGHYEGGKNVYGMVYIQERDLDLSSRSKEYFVKVTFDQKHTKQELDAKNIPLPFYIRSGKSWYMRAGESTKIVNKEIERLRKIGFDIREIQHNVGLQAFAAGRV